MTSNSTPPERLPAWGKTDEQGGWHPLAHHSMDVAAVFLRLLSNPIIANRLLTAAQRDLTDTDRQRLAALAFLHDIGKLHPGFQAKGWPENLRPRRLRGHTAESYDFLLLAFQCTQHPFHNEAQDISGWGEAFEPLILAMFAHHGKPVSGTPQATFLDWDNPAIDHYSWRDEAREMAMALRRWFAPAFEPDGEPLPHHPRFHHLVAGLAALADWIGSDTRFFDYVEPFNADYPEIAHRNAQCALASIGFRDLAEAPTGGPDFQDLTGFSTPNPAQAVVGAVAPSARLVILEAETGSGKTEAALWHFARLRAAGKVSSLYFAVPTRAAAAQLHRRVHRAIRRLYGPDAPEAVLAIPGVLKAGEYEGQRLPHWKVRWDDDAHEHPCRWATEHATRFLAAEVAVGTVDQAMLAGLSVKHAHLRGSALCRSLLVIDEVHASDAYMTEVLRRLVDDHLAIGGYALLMSATLGASARVFWRTEELPSFTEACTTAYPAVWVPGESHPRAPCNRARHTKTVHVEPVHTMAPEVAADRAVAAASAGARVLVIRNTVRVAVETWLAVHRAGRSDLLLRVAEGPALHHSRFAAEDRTLLDRAVEACLAPHPNRTPEGRIVIGTQTLEQSLDIDADFLITDLCPMDVLLQRLGRLHRHTLERRPGGFTEPCAVVLEPEEGLDHLVGPPPRFDNGLGAWKTRDGQPQFIYGNLVSLELTRRLLSACSPWRIPDMNRQLVEGATHWHPVSELLKEKGEQWQRYHAEIGGAEAAQKMLANLVVLNRETDYPPVSFPPSEERIMTRLGENGMVLDFEPVHGPFGTLISRMTLPAHWSRGLSEDDEVAVDGTGDRLTIRVGDQHFTYSRVGLERAEEESEGIRG